MLLEIFTALSAGILMFCLISMLFAQNSGKKIRRRVAALEKDVRIESVHDTVMREKRKKNASKRLISRKFEDELTTVGVPLSAGEYLATWCAAAVAPALAAFLIGHSALSVLAAGVLGFAAPPLLVRRSRQKRQQLFCRQLGESLLVMRNCLQSGYSFPQAMESIAAEMQPPISQEYARVLREMRYGVRMEDALGRMAGRVRNRDFEMLVCAVAVASQVGGNLADIMDSIASTVRERIRVRNEVRVLSAQGRLSGIIIGLLPVFILLLLMLLNPSYIMSFFESRIGRIMLAAGAAMEATGFLVISRIVDLKY